jgi:hypothetical protein
MPAVPGLPQSHDEVDTVEQTLIDHVRQISVARIEEKLADDPMPPITLIRHHSGKISFGFFG